MKFTELNEKTCFPLEYVNEGVALGSRIGGVSPVAPAIRESSQNYFATLEFSDGIAVSVFHTLDPFGNVPGHDVIDHNNQLLLPSILIHAVAHESDRRDTEGTVECTMPAFRLAVGQPMPDIGSREDEFRPFPDSKVGGDPFIDNQARCGLAFVEAMQQGFRLLAQFDTPDPRRQKFISSFPFDPGWLHLMYRGDTLENIEFAFIVQQ